jgi:hypothetical protein
MRPPIAPAAALLLAFVAFVFPASAQADGLDRALASGELTGAEYALERATALFDLRSVSARYGPTDRSDAHDATLVLRNLRAALSDLHGADRKAARALLARPSAEESDPFGSGFDNHAPSVSCGEHVCVHWTRTGPDAPPLADADDSGVPDWVEATRRVFHQVWAAEVDGMGYRAPLDDSTADMNGGDGRFDVYLSDIGNDGYFGYCTTDDPNADSTPRVSAYCVVENDYAERVFGGMAPIKALRATAAHEFFHAVQFAYDWLEDNWLMEGTAAWVEDEVYDSVDDSRRFLAGASPLARPEVPLDHGHNGFEYGSWLFWRYLSERFGQRIVRDVWQRSEPVDSRSRPYSLTAVSGALASRGSSLRSAFAGFAAANRVPWASYSEGGAYATSSTWRRHVISSYDRAASGETRLSHLATRTVSFQPGSGVGRHDRLRLSLSGMRGRASTARVVVVSTSGRAMVRRLRVGSTLAVPFGGDSVRRVDLVLVNAGTDYACWRGTALSCRGVALDDGRVLGYRAALS